MRKVIVGCHRTVMEATSRIPRPTYLNVFIFCLLSSCLIMFGLYARVRLFIAPFSLLRTNVTADLKQSSRPSPLPSLLVSPPLENITQIQTRKDRDKTETPMTSPQTKHRLKDRNSKYTKHRLKDKNDLSPPISTTDRKLQKNISTLKNRTERIRSERILSTTSKKTTPAKSIIKGTANHERVLDIQFSEIIPSENIPEHEGMSKNMATAVSSSQIILSKNTNATVLQGEGNSRHMNLKPLTKSIISKDNSISKNKTDVVPSDPATLTQNSQQKQRHIQTDTVMSQKNVTDDSDKIEGKEHIEFAKFNPQLSSLRVVSPGENIQVEDLEVHITTAVQYDKFPAKHGFNLFLNGWAKHNTTMDFVCCLVRTLPNGALEDDIFTEVKAYTYHIYTQWIVDMQNAEFSCSISNDQLEAIDDTNFRYVTFAKKSCYNAPSAVMEIVHPKPVPHSLGLCLKISYGSLNPEQIVEWFEYTRIMGVTKVFTYYFDLDPPALKVFDYYKNIGYLDLLLIHPAKSKDGPERGFRRPRFEEQAWVDEVMAANDCKHRMAGFDYVIVMDLDEFIVPKKNASSYYDVIHRAYKKQPAAGCFSFNSHVMMLDWGPTRSSPLHLAQYTQRTRKANYDGWDRNTRWGFRPNATYWVQNNYCHPRKPFNIAYPNPSLYTLLHYRKCKPHWNNCQTKPRVNDTSILGYEKLLVDRILSLPIRDILYNSTDYVTDMINWRRINKY